MQAMRGDGLEVGLDASAAAGIRSGDGQHGARAQVGTGHVVFSLQSGVLRVANQAPGVGQHKPGLGEIRRCGGLTPCCFLAILRAMFDMRGLV
jgi:hypothetical protein